MSDATSLDFAARLAASYDSLPIEWSQLRAWAEKAAAQSFHGDMGKWLAALDDLPNRLMDLHPWRKGPLSIAGQKIDTEWRSDWKFRRLVEAGVNFTDKVVLDVGCGNGVYMDWACQQGARAVIGVDPTLLFAAQYLALKRDQPKAAFVLLPTTLEALPDCAPAFDCVLSAGVLYHRPDPIAHLRDLMARAQPGGEIIVETLVVEGDERQVLVPSGRYAQMRNVWFLPSSAALAVWMTRAGLRDVQMLDEGVTGLDEQRQTDWMTFHSLEQFLDPADQSLTVEGLPRPRRAILRGFLPSAAR